MQTITKSLLIAFTSLALSHFAIAQDITDIEVKWNQTIGPRFVGFGAQMNPYLYARPNWGDVSEENVKDLEQKVVELSPQFVRVFFVPGWMRGEPDGVNKQGEPRMRESLLRTLRLAQRAGAAIT